MGVKSHRSIRLFFLTLISLSIGGCLGNQVLPDSATGVDSGVVGSGDVESGDSGDSSDSSSSSEPFPDPFEEPHGDPGIPPIAMSDEPSVFSTQVGEENNPGLVLIYCDISIDLPLKNSGGEHDADCPAGENSPDIAPPQAILRGVDSDFYGAYEAFCEDKDPTQGLWRVYIYFEKFLFYSGRGPTGPVTQAFELELYYLINGYWQQAGFYPLTIVCQEWEVPPDH